MQHPEGVQLDPILAWDWRAALEVHPIGKYGGLAWLADTLGMPRRTVYAWSSGQRRIPVTRLNDIARVLGYEGPDHGSSGATSG